MTLSPPGELSAVAWQQLAAKVTACIDYMFVETVAYLLQLEV